MYRPFTINFIKLIPTSGFTVRKFSEWHFMVHVVIAHGIVSATCHTIGLALKSGERSCSCGNLGMKRRD